MKFPAGPKKNGTGLGRRTPPAQVTFNERLYRGPSSDGGAFAWVRAFGYLRGLSEGVLVSLGRRKMKLRTRRSPLTAFVVALSLIVQLFSGPFHQAMSAPAYSGADNAAIAADLKAVFGDAANLCAHIDGKGAPSPQPPCHHCDDQCTLCRLAAQAAAYIPSSAPTLPATLTDIRHTIGAAPDFGAFPACPAQRNRARAPPLAV
jgi:hypothetical protein